MRTQKPKIRLVVLILTLLTAGMNWDPQAHAQQEPVNLLQNPGFEGGYFAWSYINEVQVAHGWTPWWREHTDADPPATYFRPEYKQANGYIYPNRVHGGAAAQQWFTFHATHQAGMYQQVFNVTPGTRYRFTIWAQVWSSTQDSADVSVEPAYPNLQIGIDPTGNWSPWANEVIWSGTYAFYDYWGQLAVEAVAQNNVITVFMRSQPDIPVKHNDVYWDDAALVAVGEGGVPVVPTTVPSDTPAPTAPPQDKSAPTATPAAPPSPTATCVSPPPDWMTYVVQQGDTLYELAQRHGTTMDLVVAANCLRTTGIYVGQELLLPPSPATSTPDATAAATPERATATPRPSRTPTATATATLTRVPPTSTHAHTRTPALTHTRTPTRPQPFTPTPTPPHTSTPLPGVAAALGAGLLLLAGVALFWRRKKSAQNEASE